MHLLVFSIVSRDQRMRSSSTDVAELMTVAAFIYSVAGPAGAFNDVTAGSNLGFGAGDGNVCDAATSSAFTAVQGWDAVTGMSSEQKASTCLITQLKGGVHRTIFGCCRRQSEGPVQRRRRPQAAASQQVRPREWFLKLPTWRRLKHYRPQAQMGLHRLVLPIPAPV
jgi:hypothetical protein